MVIEYSMNEVLDMVEQGFRRQFPVYNSCQIKVALDVNAEAHGKHINARVRILEEDNADE